MKTEAFAKEIIETMNRETKSKAARKKMAETAILIGNYTDEAKKVWFDYLESLK